MRKFLFIFILICAANKLFAQDAKDLVADGNIFYRDSQYFKAELQYRKALETEPSNREAKFNLANALLKQSKNDEAERLLNELNFDQSPTFRSEVNYNNGVRLTGEKKLEESIDAYKEALRLNPNDQEARENLQKALLELKKKSPKQQQKQKQQEKPKPKMSQQDVDKQMKKLEEKEKKVNQKLQKNNSQVSQPKDW